MNLLIGATGSVAAIKIPHLVDVLQSQIKDMKIKIVLTETASKFLKDYSPAIPIYRDEDEWKSWNDIGDPILHITLKNWADCILIAPLDANTLAKIAHGLCDNLLTNIIRALGPAAIKPVKAAAPAMNTSMWNHPCTAQQIDALKNQGFTIISPVEKMLACGDFGMGAMAHIEDIVDFLLCQINQHFS